MDQIQLKQTYQNRLSTIFNELYDSKEDEWSRDESLLACGIRALNFIENNTKESNMSVLDIGCGDGLFGKIIAALGHKYTGIDFVHNSNWPPLKENFGEMVEFSCVDFFDWEPRDSKYTLIHDGGCFHHQHKEHWDIWFEKIKQIIAPGGFYSTIVWNEPVFEGNKDSAGRFHHVFEIEQLKCILANFGFWVCNTSFTPSRKGPMQVHVLSQLKT